MRRLLLVLALGLTVVGCKPSDRPENANLNIVSSTRFEVTVVGTFRDDLAYNSYRSIYSIRDNKTGVEYIGISGVGISEVGSHSTGRTSAQDER
jgi:hypothetical protein